MATCKPTVEDLTTQLYQQQERSRALNECLITQESQIAYWRNRAQEAEDELRKLQSRVQAD